jgi:hypothetical protein
VTETDTATNFLGIPISGQIIRTGNDKPQRPLAALAPIIQAVLDDQTIVEFGWRQYTPYYDDGDTCYFGVHGFWARTADDIEVDYQGDLELNSDHPSLGDRPRVYNRETKEYEEQPYNGPDEARYDRCRALAEAIGGGEFYRVLLEAFGDHATVTIRRDGIQVEEYDHN